MLIIGRASRANTRRPLFVFYQIWRALRLIVDTGLHYYSNFTREDALWYFDKYAWDNTDLAKKEVHARTCIVCFYLTFFI